MRKMKILKYLMFSIGFIAIAGCQIDPMADIRDGNWNKERNIIDISFEGQIGEAEIVRESNNASVTFFFNMDAGIPLSEIKITHLETSYKAISSVGVGESLNFDNQTMSASIEIYPQNGEPLTWFIQLVPFVEPLSGIWKINDIRILIDVIGDFPEWGGYFEEGTISDYLPESILEYDNVLSFTFDGVNEYGQSYGSFVHSPGEDEKYGEFTRNEWGYDFNYKYRVLPKEGGTWIRNPDDNSLILTDENGYETRAILIYNEDEDSYQIRFEFPVEIYWDNPWDWEAKMKQQAKFFWYIIEKQ